jgi:hypothetical protein
MILVEGWRMDRMMEMETEGECQDWGLSDRLLNTEHYSYELPGGKYYPNLYDPIYLHRHGVPSLKNANNCISI